MQHRTRHLALAAILPLAAATLRAQAAPAAIPPPSAGILYSYQYWPTQLIQWVDGPELPYSMVMFELDPTAKIPLYHVVLTAKDGLTRTHYSNIDRLVAAYKVQGETAYRVDIAYDSDETEKPGSTSTVRFTMADGKPFEWRFVQGSDISAQGSGLTPLPTAPIPIFAYREQGAVAGEGTALKIGDTVSTAEVWKEISHPPYFVGYRGAVTSGAHQLVFGKGMETWKITRAPASVAAGSTWELDSDTGNHRTLTVTKLDGGHAVIRQADSLRTLITTTLEGTYAPATGWSIDRVRVSPVKDGDKHFATLSCTGAAQPTGTLDISIGKKTGLATATIERSADSSGQREALKFTAPKWAAEKALSESMASTPDTLTVSAR